MSVERSWEPIKEGHHECPLRGVQLIDSVILCSALQPLRSPLLARARHSAASGLVFSARERTVTRAVQCQSQGRSASHTVRIIAGAPRQPVGVGSPAPPIR